MSTRPSQRSRFAAALLLTCLAALSLPDRVAQAANPSSYSKGPGGTKVLYLFIEDLGYRLRRVFSLDDLEATSQHPAAEVAVAIGEVEAHAARKALAWARKGGVLVLAPQLLDESGQCKDVTFGDLKIERIFRFDHEGTSKAVIDDKLLVRPAACVLKVPPTGRALARTKTGAIVFEHDVGKGKLLVLAHEDMLRNFRLDQDDLAVLLRRWLQVNALARARVAFFERHAGGQFWDMLKKANMLPLLLHGLLLLLLIYWMVTPRFGDADAFEPAPRRAFAEHARALGVLYQRSGASAYALSQIYERFLRRLRYRGQGARSESAAAAERADLAQRLATRTGRRAADVESLLGRVEQAAAQQVAKDAKGTLHDYRLAAALTGLARAAGVGEQDQRKDRR